MGLVANTFGAASFLTRVKTFVCLYCSCCNIYSTPSCSSTAALRLGWFRVSSRQQALGRFSDKVALVTQFLVTFRQQVAPWSQTQFWPFVTSSENKTGVNREKNMTQEKLFRLRNSQIYSKCFLFNTFWYNNGERSWTSKLSNCLIATAN